MNIVKCGEEGRPRKRYNPTVEEDIGSDADSQDNLDECVAHCHKLRFGLRRQDECIVKCDEEDSPNKIHNSDVEEEEDSNDESNDCVTNCKAHCIMLRFGPKKQDECITKYGEEDSPSNRYNSEVEEEEGSDAGSLDNLNECMACCCNL